MKMYLKHACLLYLILVKIALAENEYYISSDRKSFLQAFSSCRRFNMILVTIDGEEKNAELYNYFTRHLERYEWFWVGGIYQNNSLTQEWYWLEKDKEFAYTDWRQNDPPFEPKYYSKDNCLRWGFHDPMNIENGLWRVDDCKSMFRYICEKPPFDYCLNTCNESNII